MTLLEINRAIEGRSSKKEAEIQYKEIDNLFEQVQNLQLTMQVDNGIKSRFDLTESANEFYKACPLAKKIVEKDALSEAFYALKAGFYFEGIPSKLTYILSKAIKMYETPNRAVSAISLAVLGNYLGNGALAEGHTIKEVINNILGVEYKTLTRARRAAKYNDVFEVYVENVDRVLVLPASYEQFLESRTDLETVTYDKEKGVLMCGVPLRIYGGRIGITTDDFDLRECI